MIVPNLLNLKGPGGQPWPLWIASPFLGMIACGLAARDGSIPRGLIAFFFGVGAFFIVYATVLLIGGP